MACKDRETWSPDNCDFRDIVGMDSNANWLLGINREEFLLQDEENTLVPFLVVTDPALADILARTIEFIRDRKDKDIVLVEVQAGEDGVSISNNQFYPLLANLAFFVAVVQQDDYIEFRELEKTIIISSPSPVLQGMTETLVLPVPQFSPPAGGWPEDTVITGVLDDGIAFAHERFRDAPGSTRVYGIWNQQNPFDPLQPSWGSAFLRKADIDAQLAKSEDEIYRDTGLVDHRDMGHKTVAWRRSHGTHVLDVAAGFATDEARTNRPILAVNLPVSVVEQTLGRYLDWHVFLGGYVILLWAREIFRSGACEKPVVINASFGHHSGPHDGNSIFDLLMDLLKIVRPKEDFHLVLPAGNAHLSRCHARVDVSNGPVAFDWMVLPNDMSASFFEVWLPAGNQTDRLRLTITTPDGVVHSVRDIPSDMSVLRDRDGTEVGLAVSTIRHGRRTLRVDIAPTERFQPTPRAVAPSGRWKLEFGAGPNGLDEPAYVWNQRDDSLYGYPQRARQSFFEHPDYVRFDTQTHEIRDDDHPEQAARPDCPVKRQSLINAIGTGPSTFTAGGYVAEGCEPARYSAGGPIISGSLDDIRPHVLMPAETSFALPGILAAGSRSGSQVWLNGTSVAAPQLTRRIVELVAQNTTVTRAIVRQEAETMDPCPDKPSKPLRGGWGRLERLDQPRVSRR